MNGYLAGVVLRRAMKGRSVDQIERVFWAVVTAFIGITIGALIAQALFPPAAPPLAAGPTVQLFASPRSPSGATP